MAKKSLAKKAPKETSKKAASNAPAPFDAKNLAHTAIFEHAEKRDHVGSFISVEFDDENRVATYLFNANLAVFLALVFSMPISFFGSLLWAFKKQS